MKKVVGILVSVSLIVSAGVPAFAASDTESAAVSAEETEPDGDTDEIHYIDGLSLELSYDDRYDLSELDEEISPDEEYVIFQTVYEEGQGITSYQVSRGMKLDEADEALLTLAAAGESDTAEAENHTKVIATGVGSGTVWLVRADQEEALREALEPETEPGPEEPDGDNPDGDNPDGDNPDGDNPDGDNPDGDNPDGDNPDGDNPDGDNPDGDNPDGDNPDGDNPDDGNPDDGNPDDGNPDDGNPDDGNPDDGNPGETIDVYRIAVTVEPATLTLMFLTGQSNMEGYCDSYTGYTPGSSIVCEEGDIYSTYVPWGTSKGKEITGITFKEVCTVGNYGTTAGDFVAGSLQGARTDEGALGDPSNMSGGTLEYPLNSLSGAGGGKTGSDSGLAYEWNQRTGDKVWVINTAYGATEIKQWIPGGNCYDRSEAVWEAALQTYQAELAAGHYTAGSRLAFWEQGETDDSTNLSAVEYEESFGTMYNAMDEILGLDAFGIFMVRAGHAGSDYRTEADLTMTGPRIAQYWLGSGNSPYDTVFVATNANEQWVSDDEVTSYFQERYGSELSYPTQSGISALPTTVNELHYDIHFSQIGHNENGITAADGMMEALFGSSSPESVSWRDASGQTITSLTLELATDTAIAVPVADPVYTAKQLVCDSPSESMLVYDAASGVVGAESETAIGTEDLVAYAGSVTGTLPVTVSVPLDLSGIAGPDYNGLFLYEGVWWYLQDGIIQLDYEGLAENEDGVWFVRDGCIDYTYTGFTKNEYGLWYVDNGEVTFETNGVIKDTAGAIGETGTWYYVVGSQVQMDFTGLADYKNENGWWYIRNGVVDFDAHTVAKNVNGWYYVENGRVDFSYNGFAENDNGMWYIENGKVTFEANGVFEDTTGVIGEAGTWYYVEGSKVQFDYNGFAENSYGWWYIEDGRVTFEKQGVIKDTNKKIDGEASWWYVEESSVRFDYTGFAENDNGKWYIENGKVTFAKNGVLEDAFGVIGDAGIWYYVVGSKVQPSYTGVADYKNADGSWLYVRDGMADFSANTVAKNKNGWWYVKDGRVDFSYQGFAENSNGKWYIENGKVTFNDNSVIKDTAGAIGTQGTWYYVVGSKVQTDFTGLANYKNENGWWYIRDGEVDFSVNTVAKNKNGWYYVVGGKVRFDFTGLADYKNDNGWWYIKGGKVDFTHSGVDKNKNGWYYMEGGKVIFSYNGIAQNSNGWWYIRDGRVDFSYTGSVTVDGVPWSVTNGRVNR